MFKRAFIRARLTTSAVIYIAALALPAIAAAQSQQPLVLTNITVVDVLSDAPQHPATVLINNGRISGISSDGKLAIPAGAQVIDGSGKYLIPGLADMHNHLSSGLPLPPMPASEKNLATLLNWGITNILPRHHDARLS